MNGERLDVVVVGGGFAGLYMLHHARQRGLRARLYEAADGVGGVWYFNRYPGARCDVESVDYSYSFSEELQQEWSWSDRYASQAEILRYLEHVADRFDLRRDIRLRSRVTAASFDEAADEWLIETDRGEQVRARFCVMATGSLSVPRIPPYPGLEDFHGRCLLTAAWPQEPVELAGQRVGVIGTGSSGTQLVPVLARQAAHLHVFQRTANFTVPAQHEPMTPEYEREIKAQYPERRRTARQTTSGLYADMSRQSALEASEAERRRVYEAQWSTAGFGFILSFRDLLLDRRANDTAVAFIHERIREQVDEPAVADLLCPVDHPFGTKRPPVDSDYYRAFNRENVTLVDVRRAPIEAITPRGLRTAQAEYELDVLIFATGFDAMVGALERIDIRGREGIALAEKWVQGPRAYLGVASAGFPNLFTITGPGSPSVLGNMIVSIEQHVEWIGELLDHARGAGTTRIEADGDAEDAWVAHVGELADATLYPLANSWYLTGERGQPRAFMPYAGGLRRYRRRCEQVAADGYEGFTLSARAPLGGT
jgi:cyclohexanone monooxygenase